MMAHLWRRIWFDIVTEAGFQGSWEVEPPATGDSLDMAGLKRCVQQLRSDERYSSATLLYAETGREVHVGVFVPPAAPGEPRAHWNVFKPDFETD